MKKIINHLLYDTESQNAELLAEYTNGYGAGDFKRVYEALYRKRSSGEYFLACEGGAMTCYAMECPDGTTGGEAIRPLTADQAQEWGESRLEADEFISLFGEVSE